MCVRMRLWVCVCVGGWVYACQLPERGHGVVEGGEDVVAETSQRGVLVQARLGVGQRQRLQQVALLAQRARALQPPTYACQLHIYII